MEIIKYIHSTPFSIVYDFDEDPNGYLRIATEKGLYLYDGHDYSKVSLIREAVTTILNDSTRGLYISYKKDLLEMAGDTVIEHHYVKNHIDPVWVKNHVFSGNYLLINKSGHEIVYFGKNDLMPAGSIISDNPNGPYAYFVGNRPSSFCWLRGSDVLEKEFRDLNVDYTKIRLPVEVNEIVAICFLQINQMQGDYILGINSSLYYYRDHQPVEKTGLESNILSLYLNPGNQLLIASTDKNGLFLVSEDLLEKKKISDINRIHKIINDQNNNIWMAAEDLGLIRLNSLDFIMLDPEKRVFATDISGNQLFFSTYENDLFLIDFKGVESEDSKKIYFENGNDDQIEDIKAISENIVWILFSYRDQDSGGVYAVKYQVDQMNQRAFRLDSYHFKNSGKYLLSEIDLYRNKYLTIEINDRGNLFLSPMLASYYYENGHFVYSGQDNLDTDKRITSIDFSEDFLVSGSKNTGLGIFTQENRMMSISEKNGLGSNQVLSVMHLGQNQFIVGTTKGLDIIKLEGLLVIDYQIKNITETDGLPATFVNDISISGNWVILGSEKGLFATQKNALARLKNRKPKIKIDHYVINNTDTLQDVHSLSYHQNDIQIFLETINLNAEQHVQYRYKMNREQKKWNYSFEPVLSLYQLPPEKYNILVSASLDGNNWTEPIEVGFTVRQVFYKQWWFISIVFIIVLSVALFISYTISKRKRRKLEIKASLIQAEQKALRAQMNPHFIFNSLNSIRRYSLDHDDDNLDEFIAEFADLIRKVLYQTEDSYINLTDEIEFLNTYLNVEKVRFKNRFEYEIDISPEIDQYNTRIPPIMIQPFLENAIWHGLMPLEGTGKINIRFRELNEQYFYCLIRDNGIGREKSKEVNRKRVGHKSVSMKNIKERIDLLNQILKQKIKLEIIDLNNNSGTEVKIYFPYI